MSKCKIALLAGALIGLLVLTGCPSPANIPVEEKFTVTVELGNYAVLSNTSLSTFSTQVTKNSIISAPDVSIKPVYEGQIVISKWINKDTEEEYNFNTPITSDITLSVKYKAADVLDFYVRQTDDKLIVSWTPVAYSNYEAKWWKGDTTSSSTVHSESEPFNIPIDTSDSVTNDIGTKYTIQVKRTPTHTYSDIDNTTSAITKLITVTKKTEWLMLMYMDGDNNLNDPIYIDLNEAEKGLAENSNRNNIRIIALWDGWDFKTGNDDNETSTFAKANIETASTRLLELGADSSDFYAENGGVYYNACKLSQDTIDHTDSVDWIVNGEVDMSNPTTLANFLNWCTQNYSAEKVILQFSNHGGGPRSAVTTDQEYSRRSMCWDETNGGSSFIKTSDVSKALKSAGYGTNNKIDLIMEDVCLGGSLEEAYELKDYSNYYIGSPNNVPGAGFNYINFVKSLTNGATVEKVGCDLIKDYRSNYEWSTAKWTSFIEKNPKFTSYDNLEKSIFNTQMSTLSFIDLSKIADVKTKVSELANLIYTDTGTETRIKIDTNTNTLYVLNNNGNYVDSYGNQPPANANLYYMYRKFGIKWWTAYYGDPIYYEGSFGCLKDLGTMCVFMRKYYSTSQWAQLNTKANAVTSALSEAVIASWRDGYNKTPTYYKNKEDNEYQDALGGTSFDDDLGAGLTINCSCWVPYTGNDGKTYTYQGFANWYKYDLAFGKECLAWTILINYWWGN